MPKLLALNDLFNNYLLWYTIRITAAALGRSRGIVREHAMYAVFCAAAVVLAGSLVFDLGRWLQQRLRHQ